MRRVDRAVERQIVWALADSQDLDVVASRNGLTQDEVVAIAERHGYPDREAMTTALERLRTTTTSVEAERRYALAETVPDASPAPSTGTQASAVEDEEGEEVSPRGTVTSAAGSTSSSTASPWSMAANLDELIAEAYDSEVKRLVSAADRALNAYNGLRDLLVEHRTRAERAAEIAELEARLAELKGHRPPATAAVTTSTSVPAKEVRAWAREAGVDCPKSGRVPQAVQDAYLEANP